MADEAESLGVRIAVGAGCRRSAPAAPVCRSARKADRLHLHPLSRASRPIVKPLAVEFIP